MTDWNLEEGSEVKVTHTVSRNSDLITEGTYEGIIQAPGVSFFVIREKEGQKVLINTFSVGYINVLKEAEPQEEEDAPDHQYG